MSLSYSQLIAYIDGLNQDGSLSNQDYTAITNYILSNGEPETSPRDLIQIRRGNLADLPNLGQGEMAYTLDEEGVYIGGLNGNVSLPSRAELNSHFINALYPPNGLTKAKTNGENTLAELQSMLDYIEGIGGGILYLPYDSTFSVLGSLSLPSKTILMGGGCTTILKQLDTAGIKTIVNKQRNGGGLLRDSDIVISNLKIINTGDVSLSDNDQCVDIWYCDRFKINDVICENAKSHGIYVRFVDDVTIENIYAKDTRQQGVAVTYGNDIKIKNVVGSGLMMNVVDIEPNEGDIISNISINTVISKTSGVKALNVDGLATATIKNINVSNIFSGAILLKFVEGGNANNIICGGDLNFDSLTLDTMKSFNITNAHLKNVATNRILFKATGCENCSSANVLIDAIENTTVGMDNTSNIECKFTDFTLKGVYSIGLRHRNSEKNIFIGLTIGTANFGVYLVPTTFNDKTSFYGLRVNAGATGVYLTATNNDVYIDGDLSGCTTPLDIHSGNVGKVSIGNLVGSRRFVVGGTAAPTTGSWIRGDEVVNLQPSNGVYAGFKCIASGTPGTWIGSNMLGIKADISTSRPVNPYPGEMFLDLTLGTYGKPIWYTGTRWIDYLGNNV